MDIIDGILLEAYMRGFDDELGGFQPNETSYPLLLRAYNLGRQDAIVGDDVRSVDYQSDEQILSRIRK